VRSTFRSLSIRNFRLYLFGAAISEIGSWMQKFGQIWLVLELTGSGTLLGVTFAIQQLPILLIGPWGGLLADRHNKRHLSMMTNGVAAMLALTLGLLTATQLIELWMVLSLALGLGVVNSLEKPTRHTFVIEMVGPYHLTNAITLSNVVNNTGKVLGPSLAGILIATVGLASSFLVNAVSFLAVVTALALMRGDELSPVDPVPYAQRQLREGSRYVLRKPELLGPLVLMTVAGTLAYEWSITLPLLARDAFEGDAQALGLMFSAMGVGAVVGGLAVAGRLMPSARQLLRLAGVFGVCVVVTASAPTLQMVLAMLVGVGAASIAFRSVAMSWIQLESSPQMRGRVGSLLVVAISGTTPIGAPLVGWLGELYGARVAMGSGGVATLLAWLITLLYLRRRGALTAIPTEGCAVVRRFAHLGEHGRGGDIAHPGEAEEDRSVWVVRQPFPDQLGNRPDLRVEQIQLVDEQPGAEHFPSGGAGRGREQVGPEPCHEQLGSGSPGIAVPSAERGHPCLADPPGLLRRGVVT